MTVVVAYRPFGVEAGRYEVQVVIATSSAVASTIPKTNGSSLGAMISLPRQMPHGGTLLRKRKRVCDRRHTFVE
jgi:hypothetical protein